MFGMENPKTSWAGWVLVAGAAITVVATLLTGGDVGSAITNSLLPALAGVGLIGALDGGN